MPDALPWDQFENHHVVDQHSSTPVHVLGAGLAGCWMARTLAEAGINVVLLEAGVHVASGASGNPAGIVKPFVTRSPELAMDFYTRAHSYLLERLELWGLGKLCEFSDCGVVQLTDKPYPPSTHYQQLLPAQMHDALGVPSDEHGLLFQQSGWLNPADLCRALIQHRLIHVRTDCEVQSFEQVSNNESSSKHRSHEDDAHWQINVAGQAPVHAAHLVLTNGALLNRFAQSRKLCITPARGQISRFTLAQNAPVLKRVVDGKHYVIPQGDSVLVGATFERDVDDNAVRPEDNIENLNGLRGMLGSVDVMSDATQGFAGVRATTPDRFPMVGPLPDMNCIEQDYQDLHHGRALHNYPCLPVLRGAYVLGGLGSRGIVTAPYSASLLADFMLGGQNIMQWSSMVNPGRFIIRAMKRRKARRV